MSDLIYKYILLFLLKGEMSTDENEVDKITAVCQGTHAVWSGTGHLSSLKIFIYSSINTANYCGAMLHCSTTMCSTINSVPHFLEFLNTVSQFTPCKWTCLCFPHLSSCICALWATRFALWLVFWKVGTYCAIFLQVLFAKLHWLSSSSSS